MIALRSAVLKIAPPSTHPPFIPPIWGCTFYKIFNFNHTICIYYLSDFLQAGLVFRSVKNSDSRMLKWNVTSRGLLSQMPLPENRIFPVKKWEKYRLERLGTSSSWSQLSPVIQDWPIPIPSQSQK